jgi:TatD DNase family protein
MCLTFVALISGSRHFYATGSLFSFSSEVVVDLPTLDAHAHIKFNRPPKELEATGCVLAMALSLNEAALNINCKAPNIAWGAGCHPRILQAQQTFDAGKFASLLEKTAIAGEIGLDTGSRVPLELQLKNFRQALEILSDFPRLVSIHSYAATGLVLKELHQRPVAFPVLHWWTGSAEETSEAVRLGCYFSIHSAVARQSKFRTRVPRQRILIESDHGYNDPPAAIPCRVQWAEYLVAQQLKMDVRDVRALAWRNFGAIIQKTGTDHLLPESFTAIIPALSAQSE